MQYLFIVHYYSTLVYSTHYLTVHYIDLQYLVIVRYFTVH